MISSEHRLILVSIADFTINWSDSERQRASALIIGYFLAKIPSVLS